MNKRRPGIGPFEARSLMLIASWTLVVAGAAYGQASTPAQAEAAALDRDVSAAFREADRNGDGQLNREEVRVMPALLDNFDAIDTDKDQHISLDELAKAVQK
jgi:Ca2+-binding EF-hand superfamily protein